MQITFFRKNQENFVKSTLRLTKYFRTNVLDLLLRI